MPVTALGARDVTKSFAGTRALSDVTFSCAPGRVHALLGENGAGKSTLVRVLTGDHLPDQGTVVVSDEDVRLAAPREALARGVVPVYQELTVLPEMTVMDNVMLGQERTWRGRLDRDRQTEVAREALDRVSLRHLPLSTLAGDLSLANQQLVEIARAIARKSRVLILDEPSAVLSGDKLDALHDVVRSLAAQNTAVVYITHLLDEVQQLADDLTILRDGAVVSTGPVEEYTTDRIVREMVGRQVDQLFPDPAPYADEIVLRVTGLVPGGTSAPPVDLEVRAGEVVGLAGLVGAGRSRFLRTVAGARGRQQGKVEVVGAQVRPSISAGIAAGVALLPEERKRDGLVLDLTVAQNTTLTTLGAVSRGGLLDRGRESKAFSEAQERLDIRAAGPGQTTRQLSGGNQQKVAIGKWLRVSPRVLLLDEPTRGVDIGAKNEIYRIIRELAASGMAIVIASSELIEVIGLSHRVLVFRDGGVAGEVERHDGSSERIMRLALGAEA